ncbi:MAG TPA: hypothetical protein VJU83_10760 [Burkholderiales bacterium]|nr:hypothetical protein [Burkholderiales bacterium]
MLKPALFLCCLCLLGVNVPAAAQLSGPTAAAPPPVNEDGDPVQGLVIEALGTGFNPIRSGVLVHGFRVEPQSGALFGYRRGNWLLSSTVSQFEDFNSEPTTALDIGASYGMDLSPRQRLSLQGGVRLDLSPGLGLREPNALAPGASENGLGLRLSWRYSFDRNRFVSTVLGYEQGLGGENLDDGLGDRNTTTFGTYFGYRFH